MGVIGIKVEEGMVANVYTTFGYAEIPGLCAPIRFSTTISGFDPPGISIGIIGT
jgi:hypothetical protein